MGHKPTIPNVLPLVQAYYSRFGNECGGSLHIVLDDGNVRDSDVAFCRQLAEERGDTDGIVLADVLMQMSKTQRSCLYLHPDKWKADFG